MKFLHILKDADSREAIALIEGQASSPAAEIGVVLIQNAGGLSANFPAKVFVLKGSRAAKGARTPGENTLDDGEFLDLIFESEKVVVW